LEWYRGHAEESDRWSQRSLELATGLEPSPVLARVLAAAASARSLRGQEDEALDLVERTMAVAQAVGDTSSYARALVIKGTSTSQIGDADGLDDILEGLRIQLDRNDTVRAMLTYNNAATVQITLGDLEKGRKLIEEAIVYGTNRGLPSHVDWSRSTRNEALFPMGEWDECLKVADELVEEDAKRGGSQVGTFASVSSALIRFFRGDTAASLAKLEEGLKVAREIQDPQVLIPVLSFLIMCSDRAGDSRRVRELAPEFSSVSQQHPVFLAGSIEMVAQAMRRADLNEQLEGLVGSAKVNGRRPETQVNFARAVAAEARGDLTESLDTLVSVIESSDQMAHRLLGTLARIDAARVAGLLDQDEEQGKLLDEAEQMAAAMAAQRLIDEIVEMRGGGRQASASGTRP
jgi:ATP/maltotriose-dependent transcriptional regulator MalT